MFRTLVGYLVLATIRTAAGSIDIALYSSLLSNGLTKYLLEYLPDAAIGVFTKVQYLGPIKIPLPQYNPNPRWPTLSGADG